MKWILADENIIKVSFLEVSNETNLNSMHRELIYFEKKNFIIKTLLVFYQIEGEKSKTYLGKLKIYFTNRFIQKKTRKQVIGQSILILFQTIVTTIQVFFIFRFPITKHIKTMVEYAVNIDLNTLKDLRDLKLKRKELKNPDELDQLVNSINKMKKNIQSNHEKLLDYSKNLEYKIKDATKEINKEKI